MRVWVLPVNGILLYENRHNRGLRYNWRYRMTNYTKILFMAVFFPTAWAHGQTSGTGDSSGTEIAFVSDTQQPMWIEKLYLHGNHNTTATAMIFADILMEKPQGLYMLGDVTALGYSNRKWLTVDRFLDSCHQKGIRTYGLLGNHDVMGKPKKGELNFQKRFPAHFRTGYLSIVDSVGILLLNSNFKALTETGVQQQQVWYDSTLKRLDSDPGIKAIIVACHHAPYSNSKVVGSSKAVQTHFVPSFFRARKAVLFITGHSHAFEYFNIQQKDFLIIGGGGGLHQPLDSTHGKLRDLAPGYKPAFHYLKLEIYPNRLHIISRSLKNDFGGFADSFSFDIKI
jgi:UDP-2,3-diacylglucosamine pyrophosphatase LpxH